MYSCGKRGELGVKWALSRLTSFVIFFVNIANCAFLCALEINVNEKLHVNDKITASFSTNILPKH